MKLKSGALVITVGALQAASQQRIAAFAAQTKPVMAGKSHRHGALQIPLATQLSDVPSESPRIGAQHNRYKQHVFYIKDIAVCISPFKRLLPSVSWAHAATALLPSVSQSPAATSHRQQGLGHSHVSA